MNTDLALRNTELTQEQIDVIKSTICPPNTSNHELSLYVSACNRTGLDPFTKQIYLVDLKGKKTVIVAIDGLRLVAQRSKDYDGLEGPWFCGPDQVWKEVWTGKEKPVACKVVAYRKGSRVGFTSIRYWAETGKTSGNWAIMPLHMFAKCTEASALRMAFPLETSGLYIDEEIPELVARHSQGERTATIKAQEAEVIDAYPDDELPVDPEVLAEMQAAADEWQREAEAEIAITETGERLKEIRRDWKAEAHGHGLDGWLHERCIARAVQLNIPLTATDRSKK